MLWASYIAAAGIVGSGCICDFCGSPKSLLNIRECVETSLSLMLFCERKVPIPPSSSNVRNQPLVYVLGGTQDSLEWKFQRAASLYKYGLAWKILLARVPGITAFSPELGRNLTNDEWAISRLEAFGVQPGDIRFIEVVPGWFGTLTEAKEVSRYVKRYGSPPLILVSAPYHTKRARLAFSNYLGPEYQELFVYGSGEEVRLLTLLNEYLKLIAYKYFLIPSKTLISIIGPIFYSGSERIEEIKEVTR
jgi:hypothetical protein